MESIRGAVLNVSEKPGLQPENWRAKNSINGVGLGFRARHFADIIQHRPPIPWFEVTSENYFHEGGLALQQLSQLRHHYPIVFHGVGMSLGSVDPLSQDYLQKLKKIIQRFQPAYVSDHLCWSSVQGHYYHELLPLVYTEETINHVVSRINYVQDFLGQQILIENVSSYLHYAESTLSEWDFLNSVSERADCFILLDVNNIYVNAYNHGFVAEEYLTQINAKRVKQFHLAGFQDCHTHLLDNHGSPVASPVWDLYRSAINKIGQLPTVIEWDNDIPDLRQLRVEAEKAEKIIQESCV